MSEPRVERGAQVNNRLLPGPHTMMSTANARACDDECPDQGVDETMQASNQGARTPGGTEVPAQVTTWPTLAERVAKAERESRRLKFALFVIVPLIGYLFVNQQIPENLVEHEPLVAADKLQLLDREGNPRLFLRIYSGVPVMQLMDQHGKPRMSLGLRYDDSPFISLADTVGQTRATLQVGNEETPTLQLFDENGVSTFSIN